MRGLTRSAAAATSSRHQSIHHIIDLRRRLYTPGKPAAFGYNERRGSEEIDAAIELVYVLAVILVGYLAVSSLPWVLEVVQRNLMCIYMD